MKRHDVLNWFIEQFDYTRYLEIGCAGNATFRRVKARCKTGVDPHRGGTHRMTSDTFFREGHAQTYDLVFVDGLHHREQVVKDVLNARDSLQGGGTIVLDDCRPREESHQLVKGPDGHPILSPPSRGPWTGDVWKAVVDLRRLPDLDVCVLDVGWGYGIVKNRPNTKQLQEATDPLDWPRYREQHPDLLRLMDWDEVKQFLASSLAPVSPSPS